MIWRGSLRFSVTVDGVVVVSCKIVGVRLMDLEVMVLELDSSFGFFFIWSWVWGNEVLADWLVWWWKPLVLRGYRGW